MKRILDGLSLSAHGTLLCASRPRSRSGSFEEADAAELIERGYAERVHDGLKFTEAGRSF